MQNCKLQTAVIETRCNSLCAENRWCFVTYHSDLEGEVWKDLKVDGLISIPVSSSGRINTPRGYPRFGTKTTTSGDMITTSHDAEGASIHAFLVHRLDGFLGSSPTQPFVNHTDGNKSNNAASRL